MTMYMQINNNFCLKLTTVNKEKLRIEKINVNLKTGTKISLLIQKSVLM
jgi:hypothetical protein